MTRLERRDFPGNLTAQEFLNGSWTDADVMANLAHLLRAQSRVRHSRESAARAGDIGGISRETIRKANWLKKHAPDLATRASQHDSDSLHALYVEGKARTGTAPDRRTSISVEDVHAAVRVLLRHFDAQDMLRAIECVIYTQEFGED